MRDGLRWFAAFLVAGCSAEPSTTPQPSSTPLVTASIALRESVGPVSDGKGRDSSPELSAVVEVCCPDCTADTRLSLTYRSWPGSQNAGPVATPSGTCAGIEFTLIAQASAGDPAKPTLEIADSATSIVASVPAEALTPRTLAAADPDSFTLCARQAKTFQWSPASDLVEASDIASLSFVHPFMCTEGCFNQFVTFYADPTADSTGVRFIVPTRTAPQGGVPGVVTVTLRDPPIPRPTLTCDGAAACTYQPFRTAQHSATYGTNCP